MFWKVKQSWDFDVKNFLHLSKFCLATYENSYETENGGKGGGFSFKERDRVHVHINNDDF